MTLVLAFANQKGGVGKTTTVINVGAYLASFGRRAVVVDLDPQANATSGLGYRQDGPGIYDALVRDLPLEDATVRLAQLFPEEHAGGLWLVPASPALAGAEVELVAAMAREYRLQKMLEQARGRYDYVLVDCPPSLGLLTINALTAADEVIIPVQCEYLALEGLSQLTQTIDLVRRNLNGRLRIGGVVLTMFDSRTNLAQEVAAEVRKHFAMTFETVIPRTVRLSEAPSRGLPIGFYDPGSRGARAYEELTRELLERTRTAAGVGS
jgi:chromosome partitioning protein